MTTVNLYDRAAKTADRITTAGGIVLLVAFIIACVFVGISFIDPQSNIVVVGCAFALGAYIAVRLSEVLAQYITLRGFQTWVQNTYGYTLNRADARKLTAGKEVYLPAQNHTYYLTLNEGERILAAV